MNSSEEDEPEDSLFHSIDKLTANMDIPFNRRDSSRGQNLGWLKRNLGIRNSAHKDYLEAMRLMLEAAKISNRISQSDLRKAA